MLLCVKRCKNCAKLLYSEERSSHVTGDVETLVALSSKFYPISDAQDQLHHCSTIASTIAATVQHHHAASLQSVPLQQQCSTLTQHHCNQHHCSSDAAPPCSITAISTILQQNFSAIHSCATSSGIVLLVHNPLTGHVFLPINQWVLFTLCLFGFAPLLEPGPACVVAVWWSVGGKRLSNTICCSSSTQPSCLLEPRYCIFSTEGNYFFPYLIDNVVMKQHTKIKYRGHEFTENSERIIVCFNFVYIFHINKRIG